jgi:hypothetical protein
LSSQELCAEVVWGPVITNADRRNRSRFQPIFQIVGGNENTSAYHGTRRPTALAPPLAHCRSRDIRRGSCLCQGQEGRTITIHAATMVIESIFEKRYSGGNAWDSFFIMQPDTSRAL